MKILLTVAFFLLCVIPGYAQIGGLSGSKLSSVSADVVNPKTLEFEPGFEVVWHSNYWDHQSILCDAFPGGDSVIICSDFLFRTTYGLTDQLEIGISVPAKLHSFYLGMKYQLARTETYGVALFGGWNTFLENETVKKGELYNMAGVGSALSLFLTEDFSLDADVHFLSGINNQLDQSLQSSFVNLEAGHYLFDHQLLAIVGFGYQYHMTELHQAHLLTLHPGFSVETGRNFSLSLSAPIGLYGRNHDQSAGFNFALTFAVE